MKLTEFLKNYPNEESCRAKFKEYRDRVGVTCPRCGCTVHYWIGGERQCYECKECGCRQSLRSHTVMHHSKLPFQIWFLAMYLITQTRTPLSACEVQRQLGMRWYRPVWLMLQKLRTVMDMDEQSNTLSGEIELDEAFFDIVGATGAKGNSDVLVIAESRTMPTRKAKYHTRYAFGKLRMLPLSAISASEIQGRVVSTVEPGAVIRSDGANAHNILKDRYSVHKKILSTTQEVMAVMPWCHIQIGNFRDQLKCVRKGKVVQDYLALYLSEFTWRLNHRGSDLFSELGVIMAGTPNSFYENSRSRAAVPDVLLS